MYFGTAFAVSAQLCLTQAFVPEFSLVQAGGEAGGGCFGIGLKAVFDVSDTGQA